MVTENMSRMNYKIQIGKKEKIFHINLLKKYVDLKDSQMPTDFNVVIVIIEEDKKLLV